jgi:hypothetical protein
MADKNGFVFVLMLWVWGVHTRKKFTIILVNRPLFVMDFKGRRENRQWVDGGSGCEFSVR